MTITHEHLGQEPVDQAERRLVSIDGLDQVLFVEAGAGTGKTTQLVARITQLVLANGGSQLGEIQSLDENSRWVYITDSEGNIIGLYDQVAQAQS